MSLPFDIRSQTRVYSACKQRLGAVGNARLATTHSADELAEDKPRAITAAAVPVLAGWAGDGQHLLLCVCAEKHCFQ